VLLSLFRWYGIGPLHFVGLQNYISMMADPTFRVAVVNSVTYLAVGLVLQVGVGLLVANALTYLSRWRDLVRTLYLLPSILSTVTIALLFQRIYASEPEGLVNQVLSAAGLGGVGRPWLSDVHTALVAVSVPDGWRMMGIYTAILLGGLLTVPREVEEAARLDGASERRIFLKVRLPHLRPVLLTTLIMAATFGLRGFDIPFLLTNGGPGTSSELLTTYMYQTAFTSTNFGYASTLAVFIVFECLVAVGVILLVLRRREA
jgi:raffinose/stachyose/melibiose transport system permease protein